MKITSPAFQNNMNIPEKFTCDGEGINPALEIMDVPAGAKSLALIVDDPDAAGPGGFVHWVIFNIDPKTDRVEENSSPESAVRGQGSSGESKYVSPCPPSGAHRYFFKLYALDTLLDLESRATREDVEQAMQGHTLDQAELVGLYERRS